ncbi:MAG: tripartite tricarboxylate transporter substrate binding protein [Betaproteobacteria bacterium]|jgi:tripartite-type tricarboxylate transporter receptor subunit TctC
MKTMRGFLLCLVNFLWMVSALAQTYPTKTIKVLVGFAAGSGPDIQAHAVAQQLSIQLNQAVYIENKMGANGTIAAKTVAQSNPDGYTLLFSSSSISSTPYVYKNPGFDLLKDLRAVASVGILDGMLVLVNAKSSMASISDLVDKAKKERLLYGSPGVGNIIHLASESINVNAGISMEHIPYKGASEVMTGLLSDSIQVMVVTPPSVLNLVLEGKVRALAFTGSKKFGPLPEVPLLKDLYPSFDPIGSWGIFFTPSKTPIEVVDKLNAAVREALKANNVATLMQRDGYFPDNRNSQEINAFFRNEVLRMKEPFKAAKIEPM